MNMKIFTPPPYLQNLFAEKISLLAREKENLFLQNQNLVKQRDLLLPRLMSGKLEV